MLRDTHELNIYSTARLEPVEESFFFFVFLHGMELLSLPWALCMFASLPWNRWGGRALGSNWHTTLWVESFLWPAVVLSRPGPAQPAAPTQPGCSTATEPGEDSHRRRTRATIPDKGGQETPDVPDTYLLTMYTQTRHRDLGGGSWPPPSRFPSLSDSYLRSHTWPGYGPGNGHWAAGIAEFARGPSSLARE